MVIFVFQSKIGPTAEEQNIVKFVSELFDDETKPVRKDISCIFTMDDKFPMKDKAGYKAKLFAKHKELEPDSAGCIHTVGVADGAKKMTS